MASLSSLVADYGTTSSSSDSDTDSEEVENDGSRATENDNQGNNASKLPPPEFGPGSHLSVFSNPFREAENAKKAILEKHVKMTPTQEETTMINGKRICWNYRKGRCRFGHNCKYAHDSDLHRTDFVDDNLPEQVILAQHIPGSAAPGSSAPLESMDKRDEYDEVRKKKKRPGLGDSIVPGKKVMKMYMKHK